jgi:serine/threonine-protein kinase
MESLHAVVPAHGPTGEPSREESRAFLQNRLALFFKVGFFLGLGFYVAMSVVETAFTGLGGFIEHLSDASYVVLLVATVLAGLLWQLVRKRPLSPGVLAALDAASMAMLAQLMALIGGVHLVRLIGLMHATLGIVTVLCIRAVVLPSTGRRTAIVSGFASLGAVIVMSAAVLLREAEPDVVRQASPLVSLIIMALWLTAASAIATVASRVIYGLRQEAKVARRIGQYVLTSKLGEGGMGVVYKATHAMLRRETAIKLLPPSKLAPEAIARFEREVCQTARLTHPNTVAVFDYGRTPEGVFYYAMEYLDGLDLDALVQGGGPLPAGRVIHILQQVCASLAEAHSIGLVHRDIKPSNVVLAERGGVPDVVKVLDFGLVKDLAGPDEANLTAAHMITGTPLFVSPEAVVAPDGVGPASDLYAVAAVGYYLLTATHVFTGKTAMAICMAHAHEAPQPPSSRGVSVPPELEALILQGLSKHAHERPASARAMRAALLACSGARPWTEHDAAAWWAGTGSKLMSGRKPVARPSSRTGSALTVDLAAR